MEGYIGGIALPTNVTLGMLCVVDVYLTQLTKKSALVDVDQVLLINIDQTAVFLMVNVDQNELFLKVDCSFLQVDLDY